jgi:hypothetical protein
MRAGDERNRYAPLECSERPTSEGFVYFLGSANGERVKIGWSKTWRRMKQHAQGNAFGEGGEFTILALVRAVSQDCETRIHSYFSSVRVDAAGKQEVYRTEAVLPYIAWLRDFYFVSTSADEFEAGPGRTLIDPSLWLPAPDRVSDRRSALSLLWGCDPWSILPSRIVTGDDYYTPAHIVACVRDALGAIDLDPASHVAANEVVDARRFFTRDQNGLLQPWAGRVFLNPPFSDWPQWVPKVLDEWAQGTIDAMVTLGASRTLTANYFQPLLHRADAFCIIGGRNPFWGLTVESESPTDGHFLLYLGPHRERFRSAVSPLGKTWLSPIGETA